MKRRPVNHANAIRMKRAHHHKGSFVIVEGRDDRLFFEQFIERDDCAVAVVEGKQSVADVVAILEADRFPGVVGVMDGDLDHVEGRVWKSANLILLETYDLEALLIKSSALERVLVELGSTKKIGRFGKGVRAALVDAAVPIGCLRLYSRRSGSNLRFDGIRYARCVDADSLTTNVEELIQEVKNRTMRSDLVWETIARKIRDLEGSVDDRWLVCCGTDMVAILGFGLRKTLGNAQEVSPPTIRRCLRLAYQWQDLLGSRLAQDLYEWAERNPGFRVLRDE